jgi:hypothetical protein
MRVLAVLTAILLATIPLPAAAKRALVAAPASTDDAMRVVVLPPVVDGTLASGDRDALVAAAERGLASESYEVVPSSAAAGGDVRPCRTPMCRHALAERLEATHVVELHVKAAERDYDVELRVYGPEGGEPFATASGSCNICGLAELEQLVASKSDALRQRLTSRELTPAYVQVSSVPSGSKVRIDGLEVGLTPYSGEVRPGPHTIEVVREGYFGETKKVTAARGVRERFHTSLSPVPRHSARRIVGWSALGVGLASLAGGATMLALDGREVGRRCGDAQRDADGDCKYVHKTLGGGIALTVAGATLTATGVTLLLVDRKRHKTYPLRASVSPRRVALSFKF